MRTSADGCGVGVGRFDDRMWREIHSSKIVYNIIL